MKHASLCDVLVDQLKDLHSAETQLVKALPKIAKHVSSQALRRAIESHLEETRHHVERLEQAAQLLTTKATGKTCAGMQGLLEEGEEALAQASNPVTDAAIVAAAQRIKHYEMAAYGAARTLAQKLGNDDVAALLQQTLEEEKAADRKLTEVVEQDIYPHALQAGGEEMGSSHMATAGGNAGHKTRHGGARH